jgi:hypothetical protein
MITQQVFRISRLLILPLALPTGLRAADFTWNGGSVVNSDWSSRFNWSPSTAPPLSDTTTNLTFAGGTRTTLQIKRATNNRV